MGSPGSWTRDVEQIVRRRMRERGVSFKEALNDTIRDGARDTAGRFQTKAASLGRSAVTLDRALQLAAALEDDDLARKISRGS